MKVSMKALGLVLSGFSLLFAVPEVGKTAPDFTIYNIATLDSVTLSDFWGEKVVLLISGNLC